MIPQQSSSPVQQQAPAAGAAPQAAPQSMDQYEAGRQTPQRTQDIGFNQKIQNILLSRIEALGQKNPNFGQAIDSGVTREAAMELIQVLPELKPIFEALGVTDASGDEGDDSDLSVGGAQQGTTTPQPGADDEEESDNPLVNQGVSRGLVG